MNIIWALIIFSLVVIIHEFGHYTFARLGGIKVNEFSLGMGPRLFSFKAAGTRWSVKLLPIGGSCMMEGEDGESDDEAAFHKKPVITRILTVFGGPLFNFILSFVLSAIIIIFMGYDFSYVTGVTKGYPAYEAGLREGDLITKINGKKITMGRELSGYLAFNPLSDKPLNIEYKRDGKTEIAHVTPVEKNIYYLGISYMPGDSAAVIEGVSDESPLKAAGVEKGDTVKEVDGVKINSGSELAAYFNTYPLDGSDVKLLIERTKDGKTGEFEVTVKPMQSGSAYTIGMSHNLTRTSVSPIAALGYGINETRYLIASTIDGLKMIVSGRANTKDIAGPVGIVKIIGNTYEQGKEEGLLILILKMANISILISANLGVMNLLPIPALDGGRLVFLFVEAIRRKPVNPDKEGMIHFAGFVVLMIVMVLVFYNDIMRIFGR